MATERGLARHRMLLEDARAAGARVEGGEEVGPGRLAPALVTGAGPGVRLVDEEPFTPIVAVIEVADTAAAIAEANRPDYGLVGYVAGADLRGALEAAQAIACGHGGGQRLAGGGALRPLRRLARLGRRRRARAARASRPSCAGSTCASWLSRGRPVHATGEDQLLELGPRPGHAAVADPAHHQVGVLVERALVDQHPRRAQAGDDLLARAEDRRPEPVGGVVGERQGVGRVLGQRPGRAGARSSPAATGPRRGPRAAAAPPWA